MKAALSLSLEFFESFEYILNIIIIIIIIPFLPSIIAPFVVVIRDCSFVTKGLGKIRSKSRGDGKLIVERIRRSEDGKDG